MEEDGRLRGGCTAAFSVVDDKGERLIILSEMRSPNVRAGSRRVGASTAQPLSSSPPSQAKIAEQLARQARTAVSSVHGVAPAVVMILEPHNVPKVP